jgi:hypothetical protein
MNSWESPIIRVSTGLLNTVNESVIANQEGITGVSKFGGQLGKMLAVSQEQIGLMSSSAIGTLYAGVYQYVQFNTGDTVPVRGQAAYWLAGSTVGSFIVSTDSSGNFSTAPTAAGVFISVPTAGNYCFIQVAGIATVKYKNGLTVGASTGQAVISLADGTFDTITAMGSVVQNFAGWAWTLPVSNSTALLQLALPLGRA